MEPAFRDTRFTRRYLLVLRVLAAVLVATPALFVLAGIKDCWEAWERHLPFLSAEWRR
jgi:hypothetical protein